MRILVESCTEHEHLYDDTTALGNPFKYEDLRLTKKRWIGRSIPRYIYSKSICIIAWNAGKHV